MTQENTPATPTATGESGATNSTPSIPSFQNLNPGGDGGPVGAILTAVQNATAPQPLSLAPARKVQLALSLGAVLTELRCRVAESALLGPDVVVAPGSISDGYWLASTWRGLFSRAYKLHKELLGDNSVSLERYGLSKDKPAYLTPQFDFINIGITTEDGEIKFDLAERLRQALNFLTCLYQRLDRVDSVLKQIFEGTSPLLIWPPADATTTEPAPSQIVYLIQQLSTVVDALLTAWDSYVREWLFAESSTLLAARYGYAAGRAVSEISWNLTVKTAPYRVPGIRDKYKDNPKELDNIIYGFFVEQFKPEKISFLQRQLMVLTTVFQKDFEDRHGLSETELQNNSTLNLKSPRAGINAVVQSLDYWQKTILEMSERGIMQRTDPPTEEPTQDAEKSKNSGPPSWSEQLKVHYSWSYDYLMDLRMALNEQGSNWFSLIAGREDLSNFRVVNVAGDLIQEYSSQITKLATQNLQSAFKEVQEELNQLAEVGKTAVDSIAMAGKNALGNIFKERWVLVGGAIAIAVIVVIAVVLLLTNKLDTTGFISTLVAPVLGAFGIQPGLSKAVREGTNEINSTQNQRKDSIDTTSDASQQRMSQHSNIGAMLLTAAGELREYLEAAFTKGYAQLQSELGIISATLAATSPLVEFVVRNCDPNNDLEFLSKIAWNEQVRRNQRDRIVVAAFGPVGAFLVSDDKDDDTPQAQAQQDIKKINQGAAASNPDPALSQK